jgi:hypothetical protein
MPTHIHSLTHTHTLTYTHMHTHSPTYTLAHSHTLTYTHIYTHTCTHMHSARGKHRNIISLHDVIRTKKNVYIGECVCVCV